MMKNVWGTTTVALVAIAACGDNNVGNQPDVDAAPDIDAPPDAPPDPFVAPPFTKVPISATGTDQLLGAVAGPDNTFYAVGFSSASFESTADRELVLVKLTATGELDTTFGAGDGIANLNVQLGGGAELFRGIAVQPDGKIVVSGIVEDQLNAIDRDVALVRFDAGGLLDPTFGTAGIARLELNDAIINNTTATGTDIPWGLTVDAAGKLYVHAAQRAEGVDANNDPRTDTDFVVVRLEANGALDPTFGTGGKFQLDLLRSNASGAGAGPRSVTVLADGSVIAAGYANVPGIDTTQPVIYKLTSAGALDTTFASGGVFNDVVMQAFTECYAIAVHGTRLVTAGYGRDSGDTNDYVSLALDAATGAVDATWGTAGKVVFDPKMVAQADNNRNLVALPGGRTALLGSAGPAGTTADAVFTILTPTGAFDTEFGTGITTYDMGGAEQFWSGAVSSDGTKALFVGFRGAGATPDAANNDDAYVVVLPLPSAR
jgi:uncharacterized delta-60 repeat protein